MNTTVPPRAPRGAWPRGRRRLARLAVTGVAIALVASACGSSRTGSDPASGPSDAGSSTAATPTTFGDLASPCGSGDAQGATAQGVTDTSITIGFGDDRGFSAMPGLNAEMGDAVKAMIAWCNKQGGINGRTLVGDQYDAAMTNAAAVMQKACKKDFMLVGEGFAYDEAAEQTRVGCGMPVVAGFVIGPNATMGPDKFESVPLPVDHYNAANLASAMEVYPEFKSSVTTLGSTSPAVQQGVKVVADALGHLGASVQKCGVALSQDGEANYMPFAEKFNKCGAKAVWFSSSASPITFGLLEAMQRAKTSMKYVFESTWYTEEAKAWNAKSHAADGMITGMVFQPFENADVNPAVKDYLDIVQGAGAKPGLLGMQAVSAFLLWADVAHQCGSDLTRECMVTGLSQVHDWTGGGLHAASDPGNNMPPDCALVVKLTGGEFTQVFPAKRGTFNCNKDYVIPTDPAASGVTLDANRHSTAFLARDQSR
ncbi:ABC transporter substrate-binding protein [Nocardioides sp.]|uniref:ABC transporter substrate-binding protein n=1 Tax=Nocardioides sp. TaxID=35761 RepID=UPI0026363A0F|nr:ABC transporter substrate-binding protein [Nocardioides sp.]